MTIKEIAKLCGVSRGTVDRVLNNRGKVKPDTEALILQTIERLGYTKNIAGRALTVRRSAPTIGVIHSGRGNPFFADVVAGIRQAERELTDYGVTVELRELEGYDAQAQLTAIDELASHVSALVLHPINEPDIQGRVDRLLDEGIPTVTLNSDLEHCKRVCYVGSDYYTGGTTAAAIMNICTRGAAKLSVVAGVDTVLGHRQRLLGALDYLREHAPGIQIVGRVSAQDDAGLAYGRARELLDQHPETDTVFVVAAGVAEVCRAVIDAGRVRQARVFAFDNVPSTVEMMRRGLVEVVICQQPFRQGYEAVRAAFDTILLGQPKGERIIMENQIRILQNIYEK
ncbi:MAG: LacI family DNA-binding transcriptional regulator [Clostridia bacterium]|nr:LacI family DNA-binding transcriptional regulator [Clostridia bacterium]